MNIETKHSKTWEQRIKALSMIVVIPTYNNDKTLRKVIEDITLYTPDILVVNDGSTDTTSEILEQMPHIRQLSYVTNRGKGHALKHGMLKAKELGYRYALTIDSDGQHYPSDIPKFVEELEQLEDVLLVGARNLAADNMPSKNSFANNFSNFWFRLQTGILLTDTQSGYRVYPIQCIKNLKGYTSKYEFELELLVAFAWQGGTVKNIPIHVYYPPQGERVSHFRPFKDFFRISVLNTLLTLIALLWVWPLRFFKKLSWKNIKEFWNDNIVNLRDSNRRITLSIMLGVFFGIVPIWGYQMICAASVAHLLNLNKVITLLASNISIPPFIPFLLYGSYAMGCYIMDVPISLQISDISIEMLKQTFLLYLIGSITFAVACSLVSGILSGIALSVFRKERT